jgi:hypothetical protein
LDVLLSDQLEDLTVLVGAANQRALNLQATHEVTNGSV